MGAIATGTTYDLTVGVKLDFEDFLWVLTPTDVPLQGTYNGFEPPSGTRYRIPQGTATEKKVEFQEEELLTPKTTLGATAATSDVFITIATGQRGRFTTGDLVRIDDEVFRVTGYGTTAETLTVTRNWPGESNGQVQHANAGDVIGLGTALDEGSDPENPKLKDRAGKHNLTEIFGPHKIEISGTEEAILKYGVSSEFQHQVANRLKELAIAVEQAILLGKRFEDTTNKRRAMGGLDFFIDTNKDTTTTDLIESELTDLMQTAYDNGGMTDLVISGGTQKRKISGFGAPQIRLDRTDRVRGSVVDTFDSDFGTADILLTRHLPKKYLFGLDSQYIEIDTLTGRNYSFEPLAKTGDSIKGQVLCEKTLKVRFEKRHWKFTALT